MSIDRRAFLRRAGGAAAAGALGLPRAVAAGAEEAAPARETGKLRLGLVTYNLARDWDLETVIRNCEAAKFEGVELRTTHAHGVEVRLSKEERERVKQRFRESKVELMGLGSAFDFHTPDQEKLRRDLDAAKEYMVLARDVGAPGVKVRPNGLPAEVPREKTLEQIARALRALGEFGDGMGVQVRLEVHGPGTSLLPNIKAMIDGAGHRNVGVCWNSNRTDLEGDGFERNFDLVKDRIFTVHMGDLFDEGYPYARLLPRLIQSGFRGFCLAEIPPSADPLRVMHYYRALWLEYQRG